MRKIPIEKRMKVLKLYFRGKSYDEIANICHIAKGSVVNIINELKKGIYPEFDEVLGQIDVLRELSVKLKKSGLTASQALFATIFMRRLMKLGVEPFKVDCWVKLYEKLSTPEYPPSKVVEAAVKLIKLEEKKL
ncbi:MAG: hypothetical protein ACTSSJ_04150 [Candidatus Odinarchaeia archaeon]